MSLPTNFKNDILAESMGGLRQYRLINNDNGTVSLQDVTQYTQVGSDFGAGEINSTNEEINLVSTTVNNIINGTEHVGYASEASMAWSAAETIGDDKGNVITETYKTKTESANVKIQSAAPTDTTALWAW